jgi:hypothetical protein
MYSNITMDMDCATLGVALCEKTTEKDTELIIKEAETPEKWFVCSFCYEIVINEPSFMIDTQCVCSACKEYEDMVDEFESNNKIYEEGELIEMLCGEEEYREDKKEEPDEESCEEIDSSLYEIFNKDNSNIHYGEGASDDEE